MIFNQYVFQTGTCSLYSSCDKKGAAFCAHFSCFFLVDQYVFIQKPIFEGLICLSGRGGKQLMSSVVLGNFLRIVIICLHYFHSTVFFGKLLIKLHKEV